MWLRSLGRSAHLDYELAICGDHATWIVEAPFCRARTFPDECFAQGAKVRARALGGHDAAKSTDPRHNGDVIGRATASDFRGRYCPFPLRREYSNSGLGREQWTHEGRWLLRSPRILALLDD